MVSVLTYPRYQYLQKWILFQSGSYVPSQKQYLASLTNLRCNCLRKIIVYF